MCLPSTKKPTCEKSKQNLTKKEEVCLPTIKCQIRDSHLNRLWIPETQKSQEMESQEFFFFFFFGEIRFAGVKLTLYLIPRRVPTRWLTQPQRAGKPEGKNTTCYITADYISYYSQI